MTDFRRRSHDQPVTAKPLSGGRGGPHMGNISKIYFDSFAQRVKSFASGSPGKVHLLSIITTLKPCQSHLRGDFFTAYSSNYSTSSDRNPGSRSSCRNSSGAGRP